MNHDFDKLSSDIQSAANLGRAEGSGWYSCTCPVCGVSHRKTGGFLFEHDKIFYKCFRASCDSDCAIVEGEYVSRKFKALMQQIGVQIPVSMLVKGNSKIVETFKDTDLYKKPDHHRIDKIDGLKKLSESEHETASLWVSYFTEVRHIKIDGIYIIEKGRYDGNCAVPMYEYGTLVGYTIITPDTYIKHYEGNKNILFMPKGKVGKVVVVVEGVIDALSIPMAVGTTYSSITPEQAYFLKDCERVIMVPDKTGNDFVKQFHKYGWELSLPDWRYKDVNKAVQELGQIETVKRITEGCIDNVGEALVKYKLWVLRDEKKGKRP